MPLFDPKREIVKLLLEQGIGLGGSQGGYQVGSQGQEDPFNKINRAVQGIAGAYYANKIGKEDKARAIPVGKQMGLSDEEISFLGPEGIMETYSKQLASRFAGPEFGTNLVPGVDRETGEQIFVQPSKRGGQPNILQKVAPPPTIEKTPTSVQEYQYGKENPDYAAYRQALAAKTPTSVQEYQYGKENPDYVAYRKSLAASGAAGAPSVRVDIPGAPAWRQLTPEENAKVGVSPQYPVMVSEKGDIKEVPGAAKTIESQSQIDAINTTLSSLVEYEKDLGKGRILVPVGQDASERESRRSQLLLDVGTAAAKGALQKSELDIVEKMLADPSTISNITLGTGPVLSRLKPVKEQLESRKKALLEKIPQHMRPKDPGPADVAGPYNERTVGGITYVKRDGQWYQK